MQSFGLMAIGLLLGILLVIGAVCAFMLYRSASKLEAEALAMRAQILATLRRNTSAIDTLRGEVSLSLSHMDADRLHDASVAIQRGSKHLAGVVANLHNLVYSSMASEGAMGAVGRGHPDYTPGMDDLGGSGIGAGGAGGAGNPPPYYRPSGAYNGPLDADALLDMVEAQNQADQADQAHNLNPISRWTPEQLARFREVREQAHETGAAGHVGYTRGSALDAHPDTRLPDIEDGHALDYDENAPALGSPGGEFEPS